jgi:hypothetical protein
MSQSAFGPAMKPPTPGEVPNGSWPRERPPFRSPVRWANAAQIALAASAIAMLVTAGLDLAGAQLLTDAIENPGAADAAEKVSDRDSYSMLGFVVYAIATVVAAICVCGWMLRSYRNLARLNPVRKDHWTGWAILGWFVPIWNLFRPKQIVNQLWRGSAGSEPPGFLAAWWALWLIGNWMGNLAGRAAGTTLESYRTADRVDAVGSVLLFVAAILAIVMIRRITKLQLDHEERVDQLGFEAAAPGARFAPAETPGFTIEPAWKPTEPDPVESLDAPERPGDREPAER